MAALVGSTCPAAAAAGADSLAAGSPAAVGGIAFLWVRRIEAALRVTVLGRR